ncbi:oligosaccharide flippase family protein [Sphingomonas sinipercae]|uniref:Oligosaccharide flippase family protein n=1 Tax=Sphingomonas sinipercae TaxID=2714944 RepID=A0A6G7ZN47_9SPHN|nr:oligosaccharide flippase family protein [Sphingomonas sinipercae]QIL02401.1 oligosaccharide flippase family protein [Sphingomonas sinipercae]
MKPTVPKQRVTRFATYVRGAGLGPFLIRASAGGGAIRLAGMATSFVAGVLLARILGVEAYGIYGIALAIISVAALPAELGLPLLVTREVARAAAAGEDRQVAGTVRWAQRAAIGISMAVALVVAMVGLFLTQFGWPGVGLTLLVGAPAIPVASLTRVYGGVLQGLKSIVKAQTASQVIRPGIFAFLLLILLASGSKTGAPGAMALSTVSATIALLPIYLWLRRRVPHHLTRQIAPLSSHSLRGLLPMGLMEGMRVLQAELSILLVGLVSGPATVGLLRIANVTAQVAAAPISMVVHAALPVMAGLHQQNENARLQKTVTAVAHAQFLGVLLLCLPLVIAPTFLLTLAYGPQFTDAANALRIIAAGQVANAAFGPNVWLLNMTHHELRVARAMTAALAVNVVIVPILTMTSGVAGGAFGLLLSMLCWNVMTWLDARKLLGVETSILRWPWGSPFATH